MSEGRRPLRCILAVLYTTSFPCGLESAICDPGPCWDSPRDPEVPLACLTALPFVSGYLLMSSCQSHVQTLLWIPNDSEHFQGAGHSGWFQRLAPALACLAADPAAPDSCCQPSPWAAISGPAMSASASTRWSMWPRLKAEAAARAPAAAGPGRTARSTAGTRWGGTSACSHPSPAVTHPCTQQSEHSFPLASPHAPQGALETHRQASVTPLSLPQVHAAYRLTCVRHFVSALELACPAGGHLEAVMVLPEGHALVPGVHDGDAQALDQWQRQAVPPAAPHNHPHRRVVALQRVVPQQAHAGQRLAAEALVVQPGLRIRAPIALVVPCARSSSLSSGQVRSAWVCGRRLHIAARAERQGTRCVLSVLTGIQP